MSTHTSTILHRLALAAFTLTLSTTVANDALASHSFKEGGCVEPSSFPTSKFPGLDKLVPKACRARVPAGSLAVGDALIAISRELHTVRGNRLGMARAERRIQAIAARAFTELRVPAKSADRALSRFSRVTRGELQRFVAGSVTLGAVMSALGKPFIEGADESPLYAESSASTVTTTTQGGWEISFGPFKIFENQTVTTVEPLPEKDEGITESCDADGNCECPTK